MIGSRLACRRRKTIAERVDIKDITGAIKIIGCNATHQVSEVTERSGNFGEVSTRLVDLFYFDKVNGALPAILETHTITWDGTDYEVVAVQTLDELMERLKVTTTRVR